mgnify:FL=1
MCKRYVFYYLRHALREKDHIVIKLVLFSTRGKNTMFSFYTNVMWEIENDCSCSYLVVLITVQAHVVVYHLYLIFIFGQQFFIYRLQQALRHTIECRIRCRHYHRKWRHHLFWRCSVVIHEVQVLISNTTWIFGKHVKVFNERVFKPLIAAMFVYNSQHKTDTLHGYTSLRKTITILLYCVPFSWVHIY